MRASPTGSRRCRTVTRPSRSLVRWPAMPPEAKRTKEKEKQKSKRAQRDKHALRGKHAHVVVGKRADVRRKLSSALVAAPARTVAVVGAGRLGSALALALNARGYRISAVVTRRVAHARRVARLFS